MSILSQKTEKKALHILARTLPHLEELAALRLTAEDAFRANEAENTIRRIIENNGFEAVRRNSRSMRLIWIKTTKNENAKC